MRKIILRSVVVGLFKVLILSLSGIYALDILLNLQFDIKMLPNSIYWSMVPLIFTFFCIVVGLFKILLKKNKSEQYKRLKEETDQLSLFFFDISWLAPLNLFAVIAFNTSIILLYIGVALSLIAFFMINLYCHYKYIKNSELDKNA